MGKVRQSIVVQQGGYDLFRLTKSKREVDLSPNTLRAYFKDGLPFYRKGKAVFISRAELQAYIVSGGSLPMLRGRSLPQC